MPLQELPVHPEVGEFWGAVSQIKSPPVEHEPLSQPLNVYVARPLKGFATYNAIERLTGQNLKTKQNSLVSRASGLRARAGQWSSFLRSIQPDVGGSRGSLLAELGGCAARRGRRRGGRLFSQLRELAAQLVPNSHEIHARQFVHLL